MGLFDKLLNKNSNPMVAPCNGEMIEANKIADPAFAEEMMGQTIGFVPADGNICAPCDGVVEVLFPTLHAFGLRTESGMGILVHIGIDTVSLNGDGFEAKIKQGDSVKAGDLVVVMDCDKVKAANLDTTTMLIVTEPVGDKKVNYVGFGKVEKGQKIEK